MSSWANGLQSTSKGWVRFRTDGEGSDAQSSLPNADCAAHMNNLASLPIAVSVEYQYPSVRHLEPPMWGSKGTTVTQNGSIPKNDAALAHATKNVAFWNTYLPPECISLMMDAGWHWDT